jgi:hypothetical protein
MAPIVAQQAFVASTALQREQGSEAAVSVIQPPVEGAEKTAREQQASREGRLFEGRKTLKGKPQERLNLKDGSEVLGGVNR